MVLEQQVTLFHDWILIGGQNGLLYVQEDNIGRVYRQTFEKFDWFRNWRHEEGRLFWDGEHVIYEVKLNDRMPGFLEFQLIAKL